MTFEDMISRLKNVKKGADGAFTARCPAHNDTNNSLSAKKVADKSLLHCFVGCSIDNVCSAINIKSSDLYFNSKPTDSKPKRREIDRQIVRVHDYKNQNGEVIYQNVCFLVTYDDGSTEKTFYHRHTDSTGKLVWSIKGIRRVPYRLPELLSALRENPDLDAYLCEGEKDADAMNERGFTASSFKNWTAELNEYVKDSNVVLLIDHDKSGLEQAGKAANLLYGNVRSLKMLDFYEGEPVPDKHGKDVSDFIAACAENEKLNDEEIAERLSILTENTSVWKPASTGSDAKPAASFTSVFQVKTADDWMEEAKTRPLPKTLFDAFWFEGEVCILFADTGKGKTIIAVQIANSICKGIAIANTTLKAAKQTVLYFDFELSDKQFETRYSTGDGEFCTNHYHFGENFLRVEIDQNSVMPPSFNDFQDYVNFSIEQEIIRTGAKVLVVDNITYLRTATETAKDALPLMKELIRLKKKYNLAILVLAHTPKRDLSKPITVNDLQGSKMISNFADSIFAVGESAKDKNLRYLKQIKARNTEVIYDAENVMTYQITKEDNFLRFEFLKFGTEREH